MATTTPDAPTRYDFLLSRSSVHDRYGLWRFDPDAAELLRPIELDPKASFDPTHQVVQIGGYLLEWGPVAMSGYQPSFPYRLFAFDPTNPDPLAAPTVKKGAWTKKKFWYLRPDFGNPDGASKSYDSGDVLWLVPVGSFLLNVIPVGGRGTYQLWNFDPASDDPLPAPYTPQGAFDTIQTGHELMPMGNYVLDRETDTGEYRVWSFDPQSPQPLALPPLQAGRWEHLRKEHRLAAIGEYVLTWIPGQCHYDLWRFDPASADPLVGPVRSGELPGGFDANTTLTGVQALRPIDEARRDVPGTIEFMRSKIKHVVYYMLENRSFDHVCGWLYDKGEAGVRYVGRDGPFQGVDPATMFNLDGELRVYANQYEGGKLSDDYNLDFLPDDPYHDKADVLGQMYFAERDGYARGATADMGGFVWNNSVDAVMSGYSREQLPVFNGLAREFAVSDAWFSSMPAPTDPNRAFAFTGSSIGELNNFQNGVRYTNWAATPHRQSIWKLLWSYGIKDWKIYNSVEWMKFVHTYHLFLEGQIPSVDASLADFIAPIEQFKRDARAGTLPAFSMLEPIWISLAGTTSYHPGGDLVLGERGLNEIYEAIKSGPSWDDTLLVITFDEHGGIYDHVPPPRAVNPWPNDLRDGFRFDVMGVRVPTLLVSPWIDEKTVFRSPTPVAYDSTSFMATLLHWFGIPKAQWAMGDRAHHAPTFEGVLGRATPRERAPSFTPPYDKNFPRGGGARGGSRLNDLHALMAPRVVAALARGKLSEVEIQRTAEDIMARATSPTALHDMLSALARRLG